MIDDRSQAERFGDAPETPAADAHAPDDPHNAGPGATGGAPPPALAGSEPPGDVGPVAPAFPWPPPEDGSVVGAFVRTWQGATLQPTPFYRAIPESLPIGSTLLFYVPLGILVSGAELFWRTVGSGVADYESVLGSLGGGEAAIDPLIWFLLSPLVLLFSLFVSAGVTHLFLKLFGGARRGVAHTTRVFAFAYSPMLFGIVPVLGMPVAFVWVVVVSIIGLREAHRTTTGRAAAAVLVPVVFLMLLLAFLMLVAAASSLLERPL